MNNEATVDSGIVGFRGLVRPLRLPLGPYRLGASQQPYETYTFLKFESRRFDPYLGHGTASKPKAVAADARCTTQTSLCVSVSFTRD